MGLLPRPAFRRAKRGGFPERVPAACRLRPLVFAAIDPISSASPSANGVDVLLAARRQLNLQHANLTLAEAGVLRHIHGSRLTTMAFANFLLALWLLSAVMLKVPLMHARGFQGKQQQAPHTRLSALRCGSAAPRTC